MTKQSEAKAKQGYVAKAVPQVCMNCRHFKSDIANYNGWDGNTYQKEKNIHCAIGQFAVKKMGTCDIFEPTT